jgi:hypothetical protein
MPSTSAWLKPESPSTKSTRSPTALTTHRSATSTPPTKSPPGCIARSSPAKPCLPRSSPRSPRLSRKQGLSVGHHLAHAASAAYTSGWDECLVVVNDAMGEVESLSVYDFHDGQMEKIRTVGANDSIGILYSLVTLHLGFDFNSDEYKIMGLAPYGNPARFRAFFRSGRRAARRRHHPHSHPQAQPHPRRARNLHRFARLSRRAPGPAPPSRMIPSPPSTKTSPLHSRPASTRSSLHVCGHFGSRDRPTPHRHGRRRRPQLHRQRQAHALRPLRRGLRPARRRRRRRGPRRSHLP